jgi:predicted phage terminase large subunit-like protein
MLTDEQLARVIALPSTLGQHLGPELLGRKYQVYPWVAYLERKVISTLAQPGRRILIVNCPPQSGKTTYMGLWLPLWYLGHNPYNRILMVAYNETYASEWGGRVLKAMKDHGGDLFGVNVSSMTTAASKWFVDNGVGGMLSAGITGGITGQPGHLILIDDVIKTDEEASNPQTKAKHLKEFDGPISDRFQEDTKLFITATRWAEDDLSGSLIERYRDPERNGGTPVEIINFKAIAEPDPEDLEAMSEEELAEWTDFLGRHYGEALKGQHSLGFFAEMRANNPDEFDKKRQGTPTARKGGMFPIAEWRYWERLPEIVARVRVWDLASSKAASADWTCGVLMGKGRDGQFYVLDRQRFREGPDGVRARIKQTAARDTNTVPILIEQSRNGDGAHVISFYENELVGFRVTGVTPKGDKTTRATGYSAEQNKNHVHLPAAWDLKTRKEWVNEHVQMDGKGGLPAHDDQIDPAAYAFNHLIGAGESILWDASQIDASRDGLSVEDQLHLIAVRQALGYEEVIVGG